MRTSRAAYTIPALLAYLLNVVGWVYILFFHRKNTFVFFHMKQSIGLLLFVLGVSLGWFVIALPLMAIPLGGVLSMALFALVIAAYLFALAIWILGMVRALQEEKIPLPLIGNWANNLPLEKIFR